MDQYILLSGVFERLDRFHSSLSLSKIYSILFWFHPRKGINFKTGHVQIKELNDIVLAAQNQTISNRNKDDCKWFLCSLFVLKWELSRFDLW